MTENTEKTEKTEYGFEHWLWQIMPPSLMLLILFTTDSGTSLVFLAGIFIIPVFVSLLSLVFKLIKFKQRKYFLLRPVLTIVFFIVIIGIANWSYINAREQVIAEARLIHDACNAKSICPSNPPGWEVDGSRIFRTDLGGWLKYIASYYYNQHGFTMRVYQGPDLGDVITGGIDKPFRVEPYIEEAFTRRAKND